ncbi:MAG TPA: NAD(P)H-dependent oxidoreductase [Steroidobacter sp.]|uniref:NADPH-dependent FMN reductase n=1 Tax=Steroidobacter sp. TaxID=1978227 RepID=UPI002EDB2809
MIRIAIITGSTRPGRLNESVARWVLDVASLRTDAEFQLVDIAQYDLPLLDEPIPPSLGRYTHEHTKKWAATVASFDAYIFVAPEYNHGISAALKNAIDFVYAEWNNKAAGFVSYGSAGGVRAVEHLRAVMAELMIADVRAHVSLSLFTDFENFSVFKPVARHESEVNALVDQLVAWGGALKALRSAAGK